MENQINIYKLACCCLLHFVYVQVTPSYNKKHIYILLLVEISHVILKFL